MARAWFGGWRMGKPARRRSNADARVRTNPFHHRLRLEPLEDRRMLSVFSVTSSADIGVGSLREAIALANSSVGTDEIRFDLAVGSVIHTYSPLPAFADTTGGTTINGDVNGDGRPDIVLRCESFDALGIMSSDNTVRSLVIQNGTAGVRIFGNGSAADRNCVSGCYIGTDLTGMETNGTANLGSGVWVGGITHDTVIGGSGSHDGNIVAGNGHCGIQLIDAIDATVQGNRIGVGADGGKSLGNQVNGVTLEGACQGVTIGGTVPGAGNVISGNAGEGISVSGSGNTVQGNLIGTNAAGTAALGNAYRGLYITGSNNTIGGTGSGARNVISGNGQDGISLAGGTGNVIRGNLIGTNLAGDSAIANGGSGIGVWTSRNTIGGTVPGAGNVVSGNNTYGVFISGTENAVEGNLIGTDASGGGALGNRQSGIYVCNSDNRIGGSAPGQGNCVAYNHAAGVAVVASIEHVTISRNAMYENGGPAIDLWYNGLTPNDPGDEDTGPNATLNYPEMYREPGAATGLLRIVGQAAPGATIEFFQTNDLYGCGDARAYLGSIAADAAGSFTYDVPVRQGGITATATDATGNTSEFSPIVPTCSGAVDAEYLLITSDGLAASFQPLVDRRRLRANQDNWSRWNGSSRTTTARAPMAAAISKPRFETASSTTTRITAPGGFVLEATRASSRCAGYPRKTPSRITIMKV